ncbi:hypothetical protein AB1Y20_020799 [Prymnesium parvum]|uniref:SLC41A/MgtE integral membrane domain-containing protein n=1 Tax=Prymnesium parvum TaxID=97485 RepID=A0AB34JY91_PRYPA
MIEVHDKRHRSCLPAWNWPWWKPPSPAPAQRTVQASLTELVAPRTYFDTPIYMMVLQRYPWLVTLMLIQSTSGMIVERFENLIQQHVILASFLTMLVGGGGNSSGQTVAELVKRLGMGEVRSDDLCRVLRKEVAIGLFLSLGLGVVAFPRVRYLAKSATDLDAAAIALSYCLIVVVANSIGVVVVMVLHRCKMAAVGSPPVVQVVVDVTGTAITMVVANAVLGVAKGE